MIHVEKALEIISSNTRNFGTESVPLEATPGRILAEAFYCDRDFPAYDRVMMDGIALDYGQFQNGQRIFDIQDIAAAGSPRKTLINNSGCIEVMTGSVLPNATDTVVRYEDLHIEDGLVDIVIDEIKQGQNIHNQGQDMLKGDLILDAGSLISSVEVGVAASIGKAKVKVRKLPSVIIISTGDELVEVDETPLDHQIRKSNVHNLRSYLKTLGITADISHLNDSKEELTKALSKMIKTYDVIMLSGGVSKGKYDYIPEVLEELGVNKLFHRVAQRPGKPLWFGQNTQCTVFALPGNPISSFMCARKYFVYWLNLCLTGKKPKQEYAILSEDVQFKPSLSYFLEVRLESSELGQSLAFPAKGNGSGDHANLLKADAFIELPIGKDVYHEGEIYPVLRYR